MKIYRDADADLEILKGKKIVMIGPLKGGRSGLMYAPNIRESGVEVIFGIPAQNSKEIKEKLDLVESAGFEGYSVADAVTKGDLVYITLYDSQVPGVYNEEVSPNLTKEKTLAFMTGFPVYFKQVIPPSFVDVLLVAPKAPARAVREMYVEGFGAPGLIAVHQDHTGKGRDIALAMAKALGYTRAGVLESTFEEETVTDLVGEQVGWGLLLETINAAFEVLVEGGYSPELAYYEVCHEAKMIMDLIYNGGFTGMLRNISDTARFGLLTRSPRVIDSRARESIKKVMEEVVSGQFAKEWIEEQAKGLTRSKALSEQVQNLPIEKVGTEIRRMAGVQKD